MAEAQTENKSTSSSATPAPNNKMVMILTIVNLVVCLAIAGVLVVSLKKEKQAVSVADIQAEGGHEEDAHASGDAKGHGDAKKDAHGGGHGNAKDAKKPVGVRMMQLEQFTVNLSSPGGSAQKFVRVNISLEVPNDEVEAEVTSKAPQVRNTIIDLFNSKRPSDLSTVDGREYLKEEIRNALNSFMSIGKIKGVYFTNFAVTN